MASRSGWTLAIISTVFAAIMTAALVLTLLIGKSRITSAQEAAEATQAASQAEAETAKRTATQAMEEAAEANDAYEEAVDRLEQLDGQLQRARVQFEAARREASNSTARLETAQLQHRTLMGLEYGSISDFFDEGRTKVFLNVDLRIPDLVRETTDIDEQTVLALAKRAFDKLENIDIVLEAKDADWKLFVELIPQTTPPQGTPFWWMACFGDLERDVRIPGTDLQYPTTIMQADGITRIEFRTEQRAYVGLDDTFEWLADQLQEQLKN